MGENSLKKKKKKKFDPLALDIFIQPFATNKQNKKKGRKKTCQHYKQRNVKNGRKEKDKKKNATFLTPRNKEKIDCNGV